MIFTSSSFVHSLCVCCQKCTHICLQYLSLVDDVIDETYGVAVVFHEDEEEVCLSVCAWVSTFVYVNCYCFSHRSDLSFLLFPGSASQWRCDGRREGRSHGRG